MSADEKKPAAKPDDALKDALKTKEDLRKEMIQQISALQSENKSLAGQVTSFSPENAKALKAENIEMKKAYEVLFKQYIDLIKERKSPQDAEGWNSYLETLTEEASLLQQMLTKPEPGAADGTAPAAPPAAPKK